MSALDLSSLSFEPLPGEKLFHYCPTATLWAILDSCSLWLSSIKCLNDSVELLWGRQILLRELQRNKFRYPGDFPLAVRIVMVGTHLNVLPLVFSLSRNGDLLSQWRAYATDGEGVAIQFNAVRLGANLPVRMKLVEYDRKRQGRLVRASLKLFASWWARGAAGAQAVIENLPWLAVDLLSLKHPSFFEEQEVRLVHLLVERDGVLEDPGGHIGAIDVVAAVPICYRLSRGVPTPYIAIAMDPGQVISGVVLGPRNPHPVSEVRKELVRRGLKGVSVRRSSSPYR